MTHPLRTGVADQIALFRAYDTDGTAKVDLTSATTGLTLSVFRAGLAQVSISSLSNKAADDTAHADGAIRRIGGNLYSVDLPDAATATYCPSISVRGTYTGGEIEPIVHPMAGYNPSLVAVGANTVEPTNLSAAQVRTELTIELARIDATISSRSTFAGGAVASVAGAVGSVTSPVTVGTNNDKTGYSLTTPPLDSNQTQAAAAAAITAADLPNATSAQISSDIETQEHAWDAASITLGSFVWSTLIATGLTAGQAVLSIRDRIGAFAGTSENTILGFLLAIMSKTATKPSDVGGDYDPATDSQEAKADTAAAIKLQTDKIPNSPASTSDVQVTVEPDITVNPTELSSGSVDNIRDGLATLEKQGEILTAIDNISVELSPEDVTDISEAVSSAVSEGIVEEVERTGGMLQRLFSKFDGIDKLIKWIRQ
jgi:hypothetical protein